MLLNDQKINSAVMKDLQSFFNNNQGRRIVDIFKEMFVNKSSFSENPLRMAYSEGFRNFVLFLNDIATKEDNLAVSNVGSIVDDLFGDTKDE